MIKDFEHAVELINLSRMQKNNVSALNFLAEQFVAHNHNDYNTLPSNFLTNPVPNELPTRNLIRFGLRVWLSVVMSSPFTVEVEPSGSRDSQGLKKMVADALNNINRTLISKNAEKKILRKIATDALVTNAAFLYDGIDYINSKYPRPFKKIINWRDAYVEPAAYGDINEDDGPNFVALRVWLHEDEVQALYGKKIKDMRPGLPREELSMSGEYERKLYEDLYPVIHWWGVDRSLVTFTKSMVIKQVDDTWNGILAGTEYPVIEEPHDIFIEYGDEKFIEYAENRWKISTAGKTPLEIIEELATFQVPDAIAYLSWRYAHVVMSMDENYKTVKKKKYPDSIYRCEFQEFGDDFLLEPEPSPYKHGQIPVSFFRRQEGASYFEKGVMAEAIDIYRYIHYLQQSENIHLMPQARPFMYAIRDALPPKYRDEETGRQEFIDDIGQFKLMYLDEVRGINPRDIMGFIQPGAISMDVATRLRQSISDLLELFGATEVMRGIGPGSEASGKHIELKMSASSRPSTFMLLMLESPYQKHMERNNCYLIQDSDERWLAQMISPEEIEAIKAVRELGDYEFITRVNLGSGMPTEWGDRFGIWMQLVQMGYPLSPQGRFIAHEMGIQVPSDAELMKMMREAQMLIPQGPGGAPPAPPASPAENINYGA